MDIAIRARMKGVEARLSACRRPERQDLVLLQHYKETLDRLPLLLRLEPGDTDPETHARIREMVLYVQGDLEGARAVYKPFRTPSPLELMPPDTDPEILHQMAHEWLYTPTPPKVLRESERRLKRAAAAAKRRSAQCRPRKPLDRAALR